MKKFLFLSLSVFLMLVFVSCEETEQNEIGQPKVFIVNDSDHGFALMYSDTSVFVDAYSNVFIPIEDWVWNGEYPNLYPATDSLQIVFDDGKRKTYSVSHTSESDVVYSPSARNILRLDDYIYYVNPIYEAQLYYRVIMYDYIYAE